MPLKILMSSRLQYRNYISWRMAANGSPELLIVMGAAATADQTEHVLARLQEAGVSARVQRGREATVIGAIGERELLATLPLEGYPGVEQVLPILKPYKLVAREVAPDPTVIDVDGRKIGQDFFGLIAGPCSVEYREQTLEAARAVAAAGATMLRGGAFKPRTSPYTFQGLGDDALAILREAREETGLPVVTELMDPRHVEAVLDSADVIQIGARNSQNFLLLAEVGRADKPVLLKRGLSSSVEELLMAAEYVAKEGNERIILCERGIKTFETATRYTLDLGAVAVLKQETHLPVIVDPSHAAGKLDPEDVRAILTPYHETVRREIESFGGVVEKFVGDAVMSVFGAPMAYGDDAERAVRAALAVRDSVQSLNNGDGRLDLQIRIAVNTGEALVSLGARPSMGESMVAGDVVNTASRLQSAAPVNGIIVGEETYASTRDAIKYEPMPPIEAKGKAAVVPAWVAGEALFAAGERTVSRGPLVGRGRELGVLQGIWQRVADERTPHLVTIFGPAGVGKTRLGIEFGRAVSELGGRTVRGRSLPYRDSSAYGAFAAQVKQFCGIFESDPIEVALEKLHTVAANLLGPSESQEVAGHLAILLGLDREGSVADRETLFFSVRRFIEAVAGDRPTMLVFEDVHWADSSLLDLIELLAARLRDLPILVLALARPDLLDARPGWGGGLPAYTALPLDQLKESDARELAIHLLGKLEDRARAERAALLAETGEGNPLFIEQLGAAMTEAPGNDSALPTTGRGIVAARLDALPAAERAVLLDAAVGGKVFWRGALERTCDDPERLPALLFALEGRDLIRRQTVSSLEGDQQFIFKHVLIRDVAYDLLPRARKRERHAQVAEFLQEATSETGEAAAALARHWRDAGESERAIDHLLTAAEEAERGWAKDRAVAFYREALELLPEDDGDRRNNVKRRLAIAHTAAYHVRDARLLQLEGD